MKTILVIFFMLSQTIGIEGGKSEIELLFTPQNSQNISNYFSKTIDLDIPSAKGTYNKDQAKIIFHNFLKKNNFTQYSKKHSGGGNGRAKFEIGAIQLNDITHRTYVLYDIKEEHVEIIELRIEKE